MTAKEFIDGVLGKTLNMPADKVASLFNDDGTVKDTAINEVVALDATRISTIKAEGQTEFDNGYKKAQREVLELREKELKQKYGITSNKVGLELIEEIVIAKAGQKVELEPEKVKLHPLYLQLQDELTTKLKATEKEWQDKYEGREAELNLEKTFSIIGKKADTLLAGFALPEDEKLRTNQKRLLELELKKYGFQQHNDDFVIIGADGKPLNDEHGHRKSLDTLVTEIASNFWPKLDGKQRQGSGGNNNPGGNGTPNNQSAWKGKIKNEADYVTHMGTAKTAEDRIAIKAEYDAVTSGGQ